MIDRTLIFLRAASTMVILVGSVVSAVAQEHAWNQPPSADKLKNMPGLVHQSFRSDLMNAEVGYNVVLPPSYHAKANHRFPVVIWLHGGGGNENSDVWTSNAWSLLYRDDAIAEAILVYPNGGRSSYWDHAKGQVMMESVIVQELIPHVDANFRTVASRKGRAVHGFSMGASGALKFAIKYPELFCSAVAYGGGAIDLEKTKMPFITNILARNLDSDPILIRKNNTYRMLQENHVKLKSLNTPFLLICGERDSWKSSAIEFHDVLQAKGIRSELKLVPDAAHEIRKLIAAEGANAAKFQHKVFTSR